jgi:phage tail-like protein
MPFGATYGTFTYGSELYGAGGVPVVESVQAIARRVLEITFEYAVKVRAAGTVITPPTDRYTPIIWGGANSDAANPVNYVFSRPAGGNLDGPGEAIDVIATYAEGNPDYEVESGGYYWSEKIWVHTDYQWTALADYRVVISNIVSTGSPMTPATEDFIGFAPSHVVRDGFNLSDMIGSEPFRLDTSGDLEKFLTALQEVLDRMIEDIDAFFDELATIGHMRRDFLDTLLADLGDPFSEFFTLTAVEKRKLARSLVRIYKEKGTCVGIVNAVQFFVGVTLLGCTSAWDDTWELADGSYPAPVGGDELGVTTYLGPGTLYEINSFWLLHATPASLTADELAKIDAVATYMKPAESHYLGVKAP